MMPQTVEPSTQRLLMTTIGTIRSYLGDRSLVSNRQRRIRGGVSSAA
jgi:hypothetical protein